MKSRRHPLLGLILPGLLLGLPHGSAGPRVIVLGFDGADPVLLERWMDSGDLPNLARLRQAGTYARLATSEPAESPVSWACFETGSNPGKTRIFDFLARRAGTYHPEIALVRAEMRIFEPGRVWARNATLVLPAVLGLVLGLIAWITPGRRPSRVAWMALAGIVLGFGVAGAVSSAIPAEMPVPVSQRRGESFWEILG
ncbi:MAG: alkaline phosphatase family protein, partial [Armatimonadetes bacterium]|nr:alkaline phosphatase family protein [Armatimonadota bacterium]